VKLTNRRQPNLPGAGQLVVPASVSGQPGAATPASGADFLPPPRLLGWLLVFVTVMAYLPAFHAGFIWDDDMYVTNNPLLTAPDGWQRIWFSLDSPSQYFPLTYSVFRIQYALWGCCRRVITGLISCSTPSMRC